MPNVANPSFTVLPMTIAEHVRLPRSDDAINAAAVALGLPIPEACMPGVAANLLLLDGHADILLGRQQAAP